MLRHGSSAQVGYAAAAFYGYIGVIGLALFLAFKFVFQADLALTQVWCTYGAPCLSPFHTLLQRGLAGPAAAASAA